MALFLVILILGAWGTAQVKDGLDLTDVVPRQTPEFEFLQAQSKYFGFYSINLVTQVRNYTNWLINWGWLAGCICCFVGWMNDE